MNELSYGDLLGGLGIFLFGMIVFEETIKSLGKNMLRRVLEKNTNTRFKAIITGIVQTCIFQSSTIVTMMTLGFVGAGVIGVSSALGVVIGANIGTTLTPWIISILGFQLNVEAFALPMIGFGALSILMGGNSRFSDLGRFLVGFGFLFLGLDYMKESVAVIAENISLEQYNSLSIWGFVLIGMIITTIIQTSTGATIITLTALNAGLISLDMALGIVIGANMGSAISTTVIGFLASTKTQNTKRQVALSHFLFNIVTTLIVTFGYHPIKTLLLAILGNDADPTIILALFHTTFNIILAVIWTSLLSPLIRFLRHILPKKQSHLGLAVEHVNTSVSDEIISALIKDVHTLIDKTIHYNRAVLLLGETQYSPARNLEHYIEIKQMEEKILKYTTLQTQDEPTSAQKRMLHTLSAVIVQVLTSSKYLKDISHHLDNIYNESDEMMHESYEFFQTTVSKTTNIVYEWTHEGLLDPTTLNESVLSIIADLHSDADIFIGGISTKLNQESENDLNVAEIIKANYYVILSCESLLQGYAALLSAQSEYSQSSK